MKKLQKSIKVEHELRKTGGRYSVEKLNEILKKLTDY